MSKKITYLFGAGASANALPVVDGINERLASTIEFVKAIKGRMEGYFGQYNKKGKQDIAEILITDLDGLLSNSINHASIDTLAKKYSLKNESENLRRLKFCLSAFIAIEQLRRPLDKRYDAFFASILKSTIYGFPEQVTILSWNYDNQFEMAFSDLANSSSLCQARDEFRVLDKVTFGSDYSEIDSFNLYKLNGSAGCLIDSKFQAMCDKFNQTKTVDQVAGIEEIIRRYYLMDNAFATWCGKDVNPGISFAWEKYINYPHYLRHVQSVIKETSDLVIVGYSFPYFNREIDAQMINCMDNIEKIYYQSYQESERSLFSRIRNIRPSFDINKFVPVDDVKQFFIPPF